VAGSFPLPENLSPEEVEEVLRNYSEIKGGEHGAYVDPDVMKRAARNRAKRLHNEDRPPAEPPTPEALERLGERGAEIYNCKFQELLGERM